MSTPLSSRVTASGTPGQRGEPRAQGAETAALHALLAEYHDICSVAGLAAVGVGGPLAGAVVERAVELIDLANGGGLALWDEESGRFQIVGSVNYRPAALRIALVPGEGGPGMVSASRNPRLWAGPDECATVIESVNPQDRGAVLAAIEGNPVSQSLICAPLIARGRVIGAIQMEHNTDDRAFCDRELRMLRTAVAEPLADALDYCAVVDQIRQQQQEARELMNRMIMAQEDERVRVSRDLHDIVGQALTGLLMALGNIENAVSDLPGSDSLLAYLRDVTMDVRSAMRTTGDLALALRPALLDDLSLASAVEWYLQRIVAPAGVATSLVVNGDLEHAALGDREVTALFRVAQECLINVVRHAAADRVSVTLSPVGEGVALRIEDDGRGFDVDEMLQEVTTSLGLRGMKERVALAGGRLQVRSAEAVGTVVTAWIPSGSAGDESTGEGRTA